MFPVYIEMPPTQDVLQVECESALLDACSEAARPEHCERVRTAEAPSSVVAVVSWSGELTIRVEVEERPLGRVAKRLLSFSPEDPFIEHCRAAGFVTGTLLEASLRDEIAGDRAPPAPDPAEVTPSDATSAVAPGSPAPEGDASLDAARPSMFLDGGCLFGTGPAGTIRYGPGFAVGVRLSSGLLLRVDGDMTFSTVAFGNRAPENGAPENGAPENSALRDGVLPTRFWSVGAAAGAAWPVASETWLELSAGPFIENVSVQSNADGRSDGRFIGGMRASLTLRQHLVDRVSALIAAAGGARFGDTTVRVDGDYVAHVPAPFGGGLVALSVDLR